MRLRVGVLGSTRGTALQAVLDAIKSGELNIEVVLVVSNRESASILERAARYGVDTLYVSPTGLTREEFDRRVSAAFNERQTELILMIGYMRIVTAEFVRSWRGRLLNVHPSLLPAFGGLMNEKVHEAVLESGVQETGCTIHQVTEEVDAGPVVLQKRCTVFQNDTVEVLKQRVQELEQQAFVEVLQNWKRA
jgi:phosphoribosylglycinamide formyltransferase-1